MKLTWSILFLSVLMSFGCGQGFGTNTSGSSVTPPASGAEIDPAMTAAQQAMLSAIHGKYFQTACMPISGGSTFKARIDMLVVEEQPADGQRLVGMILRAVYFTDAVCTPSKASAHAAKAVFFNFTSLGPSGVGYTYRQASAIRTPVSPWGTIRTPGYLAPTYFNSNSVCGLTNWDYGSVIRWEDNPTCVVTLEGSSFSLNELRNGVFYLDTSASPMRVYLGDESGGKDGASVASAPTSYDMSKPFEQVDSLTF